MDSIAFPQLNRTGRIITCGSFIFSSFLMLTLAGFGSFPVALYYALSTFLVCFSMVYVLRSLSSWFDLLSLGAMVLSLTSILLVSPVYFFLSLQILVFGFLSVFVLSRYGGLVNSRWLVVGLGVAFSVLALLLLYDSVVFAQGATTGTSELQATCASRGFLAGGENFFCQFALNTFQGAAGDGAGFGDQNTRNFIITAIKLVFNAIRVVIIVYVGVSIFETIKARQRGEDWGAVLAFPAFIVASVIIGDVVIALITGNRV